MPPLPFMVANCDLKEAHSSLVSWNIFVVAICGLTFFGRKGNYRQLSHCLRRLRICILLSCHTPTKLRLTFKKVIKGVLTSYASSVFFIDSFFTISAMAIVIRQTQPIERQAERIFISVMTILPGYSPAYTPSKRMVPEVDSPMR